MNCCLVNCSKSLSKNCAPVFVKGVLHCFLSYVTIDVTTTVTGISVWMMRPCSIHTHNLAFDPHLRLQKSMMVVMAEMLMSKLQNISELPHGYPLVWSFIYFCLYLSAGDASWIFGVKRTKIIFVVKVKQAEKKHKEMLLGTTVLLESNTAIIMLMSVFYVPLRQLPSSKFIIIS